MRLVVTGKERMAADHVGPLGEASTPPCVILGNGMELREVKGNRSDESRFLKDVLVDRRAVAHRWHSLSRPRCGLLDHILQVLNKALDREPCSHGQSTRPTIGLRRGRVSEEIKDSIRHLPGAAYGYQAAINPIAQDFFRATAACCNDGRFDRH